MSLESSLELFCAVLVSVFYSAISYLLGRPFFGHRLSIGRLTLWTARDVHFEAALFSKTYRCSFRIPLIAWSFHIPRSVEPRWCTITLHDIFYKSPTGDISIGRFELVLWFFPVFFRQSTQPWGNVVIDDFRVLVFRSIQTPYYIHRLREKLVSALLTGDVMRCDMARTTCRFSGVSDLVSDGRYTTVPMRTSDKDEMCFSWLSRQLHIYNCDSRVYAFGSIDAQVRRSWSEDRGSFVMNAEELRWVHVPYPFEMVSPRGGLTQLFSSLFHFPLDLMRIIHSPSTSVNLLITRLDVRFDAFRIRDAEMLRQGLLLLREKAKANNIHWNDLFVDALAYVLTL
ncbi:hypothetical protein BD310DRAFT_820081 [Dichomitus squalens]|uniref:Uncharacterized protein n=1 Tax=Dichomitus squalens TaxID=114155 RepID=A0A4Q9PU89_9APHY|nr:hypothetical protein BD310DRAFT_820081 [Dichomitus squalens]